MSIVEDTSQRRLASLSKHLRPTMAAAAAASAAAAPAAPASIAPHCDADLVDKLKTTEDLTIVVFGASGDLARKKIYPVLWTLFRDCLLPAKARARRLSLPCHLKVAWGGCAF